MAFVGGAWKRRAASYTTKEIPDDDTMRGKTAPCAIHRVAKSLIFDAEACGLLHPRGTIIEATGGSTGISLALIGAARGYKTLLTMPDITAKEKVDMMKIMGAQVHISPTTSMADKEKHFFHVA
ncbi:hypothetical protein PsorP6_010286 [Peronosclerospora sorghi]|uniref:Uncharacterized protein n=1 Tax=Peronosclerospora sorghi TaxID=230839 RepID=A0ACC0VWR5_9STRA|nr:hypothetical protein PsorP6_010286 [Peronosclerospora sorghi]